MTKVILSLIFISCYCNKNIFQRRFRVQIQMITSNMIREEKQKEINNNKIDHMIRNVQRVLKSSVQIEKHSYIEEFTK